MLQKTIKKIKADNKSIPDSKFDGIDFKKLKGKLKLPVKGKIIHKFNSKEKILVLHGRAFYKSKRR